MAAYYPSAPSSDVFDMQTTVDPSYIISLIRKLLPNNIKTENEAAWEEFGCILWDLAVDKDLALLMVENLLLQVLLASLTVSKSSRITEIGLGLLANIACHDVLRNSIVSLPGLIDTVVDHLFVDDSLCLCQVFWLLTLGLQGSDCVTWANALQPEHILRRIFWVSENTLNIQLLEKVWKPEPSFFFFGYVLSSCPKLGHSLFLHLSDNNLLFGQSIGLVLAIVDSQQVGQTLLPSLMQLGLPNLLVSILACEMKHLSCERVPDRYPVLDTVLRVIEALSVLDNYSEVISSNKELLHLIYDLLKLPDKSEPALSWFNEFGSAPPLV
ncbi:hypothetical protein IFM89_012921 [Coptis chinensis]|uniref:Uncharacterized protein n=1 Tax=Coptis chinensis TaxID=261450 RepID=A0A835LLB5_9MAGN|nr:hypothetical protein IFM89_012921 [Coptis chinensis]